MPHRKTMNVSLTPELDTFVTDCVGTGRYSSNSEVIRAALRLLQEEEGHGSVPAPPKQLAQQPAAASLVRDGDAQ
jgi:putative addiction module CopG family antidote